MKEGGEAVFPPPERMLDAGDKGDTASPWPTPHNPLNPRLFSPEIEGDTFRESAAKTRPGMGESY
jgi:hypothetical protein